MTGRQGALAAAAGAISFIMAAAGWEFFSKTGIPTLGIMVAIWWIAPVKPHLGSLGEGLFTQFFVDWIFWFVVMWLVYVLIARIGRRLKWPS